MTDGAGRSHSALRCGYIGPGCSLFVSPFLRWRPDPSRKVFSASLIMLLLFRESIRTDVQSPMPLTSQLAKQASHHRIVVQSRVLNPIHTGFRVLLLLGLNYLRESTQVLPLINVKEPREVS